MKKMTVTKFGQLDCLPSFGGCHLFLFLFVDSLFEAPTKWKMWAFYGSSLLSVAVWAAYLIHEDDNPKGGAA